MTNDSESESKSADPVARALERSNDSDAIFRKLLDPSSFTFPPNWDYWLQVVTQTLFAEGVRRSARMFFDAAVRDATLHLEDRLRTLCDAPVTTVGTELVDFAFHPDTGFLTEQRAPLAERQGLFLLYKGVVLSLRNPLGHRKTNLDPRTAYDAIAMVDYLLDRANSAALERLVFPFLTRLEVSRSLISTHRVDINGDGTDELLVLVVETQSGSHRTRMLALGGDPLRPLTGGLPTIRGGVAHTITLDHDFDGDGVSEVFLTATSVDGTSEAMLLDFDDGRIGHVVPETGTVIGSGPPGFHVIRPAELGGKPAIVAFDAVRQPQYWVQEGQALVRTKPKEEMP